MKNRQKRLVTAVILIMIQLVCLCFASAETQITIPQKVTVIPAQAFENVPLQNVQVILPEKTVRIESRAFAGTGITTLELGSRIKYIADDAFDGCNDFHPIVYPNTYAAGWCSDHSIRAYTVKGLGVTAHTQGEIRSFVNAHPAETESVTQYRKNPTGGEYGGDTYNYGLIAKSSLTNGINMLNNVRYVAGLNANVVNAPDKEAALGASALVNALNGGISHYPGRPEVLSDSKYDTLYQLACSGSSSSNLFSGPENLAWSILGYMDDSDSTNIDRVGHRRWILNPSMGKTTFGFCHGTRTYVFGSGYTFTYTTYYSGLYAFDESGSGTQKPVAWPAQQTPVSYFRAGSAWSVSYGKSLDKSKIHVTLTRDGDGKTWAFSSKSADGYFNVENSHYGLPGCVIFRANDLTVKAGDTFQVTIRDDKNYELLEYRVTFFSL